MSYARNPVTATYQVGNEVIVLRPGSKIHRCTGYIEDITKEDLLLVRLDEPICLLIPCERDEVERTDP